MAKEKRTIEEVVNQLIKETESEYGSIMHCRSLLNEILDIHKDEISAAPCKLGDTIWELCLCDDNKYRVFPMIIKSLNEYGSIRWTKEKEPVVWNIYAESPEHSTYMYKSFYELNKSWFLSEKEAKEKLAEITGGVV